MTNFFEYTVFYDTDSSLIDGIYYNQNTNNAYVAMNDDVYRYRCVPQVEIGSMVAADSIGSYFNTNFKDHYHAESIGKLGGSDDNNSSIGLLVPLSNTTGGESGLNLSADPSITVQPGSIIAFRTQVDTAPVDNVDVYPDLNTEEHSLQEIPQPDKSPVTYTLVFNGGRTYTPDNVSSVDEAIDALRLVSDIIGVSVDVEQVIVNFKVNA